MEYERINWENLPSQETPINANNLNRIDFALYLLASSENTVILDAVGDGETDDTEALSEVFNRSNSADFNITWDGELTELTVGNTIAGYLQYVPEEATTGLTLTVSSDDTSVVTVSISGQDVDVTGVAAGETLIRVSIPYGVEYAYDVVVT